LLPSPLTLVAKAKFTVPGTVTVVGGVAARVNSGIAVLTAETIQIHLAGEDMSSLGTAQFILLKTETVGKPCSTAGQATGTVLVSASYHLVLEVSTKEYALLYLVPATEILCQGLNFTVTGSEITIITILKEAGSNPETDTKKFDVRAECNPVASNKPKFSKYFTDTGEATAKLELTKPLKEEMCLETATINTASTEMFELMET
jgi:hypothetical protein